MMKKNIDQMVILQAIDLLLPHVATDGFDANIADEALRLIKSIKRKLDFSEDDTSLQSNSEVLKVLSSELSQLIVTPETNRNAKDRLGESGDLSPNLYSLEFGENFKEVFAKFGIRRRHVEDVVFSPDSFEHFSPGDEFKEKVYISLYSKVIEVDGQSDFSIVVQTVRNKSTQRIDAVWKVCHDLLGVSRSSSSETLFKAFIEHYGVDINIFGEDVGKLLFYKQFNLSKSVGLNDFVKFNRRGRACYLSQYIRVSNGGGMMDVALAYIIDLTLYKKDLLFMGQHVSY